MGNIDMANAILRSLRRMNQWAPEIVVEQMKQSENFPKAIAQYII